MYSISNLYHIRKVCGVFTDIEFQGTKYNTIDVMIKFFEENKYEYTIHLLRTQPYHFQEQSQTRSPLLCQTVDLNLVLSLTNS